MAKNSPKTCIYGFKNGQGCHHSAMSGEEIKSETCADCEWFEKLDIDFEKPI